MLVTELFEDSWSGPGNAWHDQGSADQWYDGNDQWHGEQGAGMVEDLAVTNMVATEGAELSDIISARDLINHAVKDPQNEKHKYFEFLKHLRTKYGTEYSTLVHQQAAKLANAKDNI